MFDPDGSSRGKSVRSLLSLAGRQKPAAARPAAPSLTSLASDLPDAKATHRAARSRREAQPNPLLRALAEKPQPAQKPQPTQKPQSAQRAGEFDQHLAQKPNDNVRMPRDEAFAQEAGGAPQPSNDHWVDYSSDQRWTPLFDPAKIIGGIIKSRYLILATTALGGTLAVFIALSTPKTYTSVTDIQIDPRDIKVFDRTITEGGLPSDATLAIVENQVRVIRSGTVIDKVVEKLNLEADPEFNGSEGSFGLSSLIGEIRSIFSRSEPSSNDRKAALARENLYEGLTVERAGKTFIVSIAMKTQDREKSALIANTVAEVFMTSYAGLASDTAGKASDELSARLVELQKEVEAAERKVEAFQAEHELIDAKGGLISDDEIIRLNDQLTIAKARTLELNARASTARELDLNSVVGGGLPEGMSSPVISDLRAQYSTAKQALDRAAVRLGPRHPQRQSAEAELAGIRDQISTELRRLVSSVQIDLKRAVQLEQDLAARLAQLKAKQGNVGESLVDLRELEREAAAKRAVYENFLLRARETGEQSGINTANVSVISKAQPPLDANGPSRSMMVIAGALLGFLAGLGLGILRGAWDSLRAPRPGGTGPQPYPGRQRDWRSRNDDDEPAHRPAAQAWAVPPRRAAVAQAEPAAPQQAAPRPAIEQPVAQPQQPPQPQVAPEPQQQPPAWQQPQPVANQNWAAQPAMPQPVMAQPVMMQQPVMQQPVMMQQPVVYAQPPVMQAWPPMMPQMYAPQPYMPQPWMQPQPMVYAAPAQPVYAPQQPQQAMHPAHQVHQPSSRPPLEDLPVSAVDEIRGSLREFREAVRNLAENRVRASR